MARAVVVLALLMSVLAAACGGPNTPTTAVPTPPSRDELAKGGFVYPAIPRITAEELKLRIDRKEPLIVIDNRSVYKFQAGHLAGAFNITYSIDSPYAGAEEDMDRKLVALPDDVLKVFYCD